MKKSVKVLRRDISREEKQDYQCFGHSCLWSISISKEKANRYWLYHGVLGVGAHGSTIKKAMEKFRSAVNKRIIECAEVLAELDGISEFKLEENIEAKEALK